MMLPPRARQALEYLAGPPIAGKTQTSLAAITLAKLESGPKLGRWEVYFSSHVGGWTLSHGAMGPLIRLDIMGASSTKAGRLGLTHVGLRIVEDYLRRARERDTSLPLSSVGGR